MRELLVFSMAKKTDFIHIRSDAKLHEALKASATRAHRKMQDQARYLLEKALGIAFQEDAVIDERLRAAEEHAPYGNASVKGGNKKSSAG